MKNWKSKILIPAMLVLMSSVLSGQAPSTPERASSAQNSPNLTTRAKPDILAACAAAAEELSKTRVLVSELESENQLLNSRLQTEKQATVLLGELNETRKSENAALRTAIDSKNETIAAKDSVIAAQEKLVESLRRKKASPWKRVGDVLIGAAAVFILR